MADTEQSDFTAMTVQLLSAYFSNNQVPAGDIAGIIEATRGALERKTEVEVPAAPDHVPAVSIRKSLGSREHIISMLDGKPYKTLKRHLAVNGLTPAEYRERYNLPKDYPMVAPAYSEQRRIVAQKLGLGRRVVVKAQDAAPVVEASPVVEATPVVEAAPVVETAPAVSTEAKPKRGRGKAAAAKPSEQAEIVSSEPKPEPSTVPAKAEAATIKPARKKLGVQTTPRTAKATTAALKEPLEPAVSEPAKAKPAKPATGKETTGKAATPKAAAAAKPKAARQRASAEDKGAAKVAAPASTE
ncbi:MucR family transcriptional regulator [Sphingobium sp. D43FB]|uniref:MucR family transcriptional regulator n=1 Tax=Sphingobium sp. D43FB TaxID=2017595 RepID=UPI000BB55240|nr:MucR family transcriptional regulator [Sphingobium sp. D43FB]PBN41536.1 MucR family transcriptional regulator [Sphingobium sp. D43FB]